MKDIILRDCGRVGWLGIIEQDGKEVYRTGKHHSSYLTAMDAITLKMNSEDDHEDYQY